MIGVLSLNPEGGILASRVTPERPDLIGTPLSALWSFDSADTAMLLAISMKRDGFALNATVTTVDGFVEDRLATFARTGRADAPLCVTFSAPYKDTAPLPHSPPLLTGRSEYGGGSIVDHSRAESETGHKSESSDQALPTDLGDAPPIGEAIASWISLLTADGHAKTEIRRKQLCVEWFAETAQWRSVSDITSRSITDARCEMAGSSSKTVRNQLSRLRVFLDYCVSQEWLATNPTKSVKPPKLVKGEGVRALTSDEVKQLIEHTPTQRWAYYMFAAWTGLRHSECRRLQWKHVVLDEDSPRLELPASLTKSRVAKKLPLVREAVFALTTVLRQRIQPDDKVFDPVPVLRTFNKDLERAGIPKYDERGRSAGIHSLRKHLATALANGGADIYTAQAMLRHADIQTTRNSYIDDQVLDLGTKAVAALDKASGRDDEDSDDDWDDEDDLDWDDDEEDVPTIEQALDSYLASLEIDGHNQTELKCKRGNISWFADQAGWRDVTDITAAGINEAKLGLSTKSSGTIRKYLIRLSGFLDFCVAQEWIRSNPSKVIKKPRHVKQEGVRALSTEEVERLIQAVPADHQERKAYYTFAAWTGLRVGECGRLQWRHVDLTGEFPCLNLTADMTKNKKSAMVPLNHAACGALAMLRPPTPSPTGNVFSGIPVARTFDRDLSRAGIPKRDERNRVAGRHSLRKHLATHLEVNGVDPTVIQSIMRHAKLDVTCESYLDERLMNLAVRGMNALEQPIARPTQITAPYIDSKISHVAESAEAAMGTGAKVERPVELKLAEG